MGLIQRINKADKMLRVALLGTALLIVPQIGQFLSIQSINASGHESDLALLFKLVAVLVVPTSVILSAVLIYVVRKNWRQHERIALLGAFNILISLNLIWFFFDLCSWAHVFAFDISGCHI